MKPTGNFTLLWLIGATFHLYFFSCDNATTANIHGELYVRYDADTKELKAEALFSDVVDNELGESVVFPKGVQFINSGMRTVELPGDKIRYEAGVSGQLPIKPEFTWHLKNGEPMSIPAQVTQINGFDIQNSTISLSQGLTIYLNTSHLAPTEKLLLAITDADGKAKNLETKGPTSKMHFKIPGSEVRGLTTGSASLYVVRSKREQKMVEGHALTITTEYYSVPQKVEIVK